MIALPVSLACALALMAIGCVLAARAGRHDIDESTEPAARGAPAAEAEEGATNPWFAEGEPSER